MDCLIGMNNIPDKSIDMILCDLPYGILKCKWDKVIDNNLLFKQYNRIIKNNGAIVLTATQPFATDLINANRKYFRYDLIWEKTLAVGFANCNKMPMRKHECILVFYKHLPTYNPQGLIEINPKEIQRYKNKNRATDTCYNEKPLSKKIHTKI